MVARGRRVLAALTGGLLVAATTLVSATAAAAKDLDPELYPPPPVEEKVVPPPPDRVVELVPTGIDLAWPWYIAAAVGLLAAGVALVLVRRRLARH